MLYNVLQSLQVKLDSGEHDDRMSILSHWFLSYWEQFGEWKEDCPAFLIMDVIKMYIMLE